MSSPRGIRNLNPTNIEDGGFARGCDGYAGHEPEGRFARFATMAHGLAAAIKLLRLYRRLHSLTTIRGIINRWAPPADNNDTSAYAHTVSARIGVGVDVELPDEPYTYRQLVWAMATVECGFEAAQAAIHDTDLDQAVALVYGTQGQPVAVPAADVLESPPAPAPSRTAEDELFGGGEGGRSQPLPKRSTVAPDAPEAPSQAGRTMDPITAVSALGSVIPSLIRLIGGSSPTAERNAQVAQILIPVAQQVTGTKDLSTAVGRVLAEPATQQQFKAAVQAKWEDVGPFLKFEEQSRADARTFADTMTGSGPTWRAIGFGVILAVLAIVVVAGGGYVLREMLQEDSTDLQTKGMIIGAVIAFITQILSYFFGSSASSRNKDQALADAAKR